MNKKGQIFSLDFILSLAVIILTIGLMLQFMELQEYNQREAEIQNELYSIGETASHLLVSSPSFSCQMDSALDATLMPVLGCILINAPAGYEITKERLGIPINYKCEIEAEAPIGTIVNINNADCIDDHGADNPDNFYSSKRNAVFFESASGNAQSIYKSELYHFCKPPLGVCTLETGEIKLWVWK